MQQLRAASWKGQGATEHPGLAPARAQSLLLSSHTEIRHHQGSQGSSGQQQRVILQPGTASGTISPLLCAAGEALELWSQAGTERIPWDKGSGAQSSRRRRREAGPRQNRAPGSVQGQGSSEQSRGSWGDLLLVQSAESPPEPTGHLCSQGTAAHSKAEIELFTPSHDKPHFPDL